ncbi:MAG: class I SAM-dependent methyltransferase, partial [Alphaproteobacteria bacterium]
MIGASPAAQRAVNRALWRDRGGNWARTAPEGRSPIDGLNQELIAAAGINPGQIVLDIAGGSGDPTISIALHVGISGRVFACDLAAEMQIGARRRAAKLGLANIAFAVADMESLAFAD